MGLRYETLILESKELLRKRFIWCLWSTENGSLTVQKWSERGCWNQGTQVSGQLRDQGPLLSLMPWRTVTTWVEWLWQWCLLELSRVSDATCAGNARAYGGCTCLTLGWGRCRVPAQTPGSGSSIMIVPPPFISCPPPSQNAHCACHLVSAQETLIEGRWAGRWVCALILIAQHPDLSASTWSLHTAWFLFHFWIIVSEVGHLALEHNSWDQAPSLFQVKSMGNCHGFQQT